MIHQSLGDRLRYALDIRNIKHKDFASRIGITNITLSRYINGTRVPNAYMIRDICRELGISSDWLLGMLEDKHISGKETE